MTISATAGYLSLFIGSFLASSILPGGVEVLLFAMMRSGEYAPVMLLAIATAGNTLGGVSTYGVGVLLQLGAAKFNFGRKLQARFRLDEKALARVRRWGLPCLLFSWMPIVGDPLCLAAGYLRLNFWHSAVLIGVGKFLRYLVLLWLFGWR